jgi:hypothetical protein
VIGVLKELTLVPEISRFLGIVIQMYYNDHEPAHFHAKYGKYRITVEIDSGVVEGAFPRRALGAVLEWYTLHTEELTDNWRRAQDHEPLVDIDPLE